MSPLPPARPLCVLTLVLRQQVHQCHRWHLSPAPSPGEVGQREKGRGRSWACGSDSSCSSVTQFPQGAGWRVSPSPRGPKLWTCSPLFTGLARLSLDGGPRARDRDPFSQPLHGASVSPLHAHARVRVPCSHATARSLRTAASLDPARRLSYSTHTSACQGTTVQSRVGQSRQDPGRDT